MCTALSFTHNMRSYFGRNMDIPFFFNQSPILIPTGFKYLNRAENKTESINKSILGMGSVIDSHPAMAEAMNECGLACAGLNFAGYAKFDEFPVNDKLNIAPYDFILWALSEHDSIEDVKDDINNMHFYSVPLNDTTPVSQLHWMLADKSGNSIVVECTEKGLNVYDNPVSVMTNNPVFPWHLTNLREYMKLSAKPPAESSWSDLRLQPLGVGAGSLGLPGDYASVSRFIRAAFAKANLPQDLREENHIAQFFHMLNSCLMPKGCVLTEDGLCDYTTYSSCMDLVEGVYYYKNYENSRINAVKLIPSTETELKLYPYSRNQDINYLN